MSPPNRIAAIVLGLKDNSDIIVTQALVNCTRRKPQISVHESKVTGNRTKRTVSEPLRTKRSHRASIHTHSHVRLIARDLSGFYPNSTIIPLKPASELYGEL